MSISLIAALDERGLIGTKGRLPWRLTEDLRRFRRLTMGKPVLMGRRTFESIGRPLDGRANLVLTRDAGYRAPGCRVVTSLDAGVAACRGAEELMVIGGAEVYALALPRADRLYLTRVRGAFEGEVYFPSFEESEWREECRWPGAGPGEPGYCFVTYRRRGGGTGR